MSDKALPVVPLAAIAAGMVAAAAAARGLSAAIAIALDELDYRAGTACDTWFKFLR